METNALTTTDLLKFRDCIGKAIIDALHEAIPDPKPEAKGEMPPKPESTVWKRDGKLYAVTGECRVPQRGESWMHPTLPSIMDGGNVAHTEPRWILARRPDAPPEGYEFTDEYRQPNTNECYLNNGAVSRGCSPPQCDMCSEPHWILRKLPVKSAYEKALDTFCEGQDRTPAENMAFCDGWNAAKRDSGQ